MIINYVCACPGEGDYDLYISCMQDGIECNLFILDFGYNFHEITNIKCVKIDKKDIVNLPSSDLTILRYPQSDWPLVQSYLAWTSEQGATLHHAKQSLEPYQNIALNNKLDFNNFKENFPNKKVLYFPFGGRRIPDLDYQYECDIIASCNPHFSCKCEGRLKRQSIEVMLLPLYAHNLHTYGMWDGEHGWNGVTGLENKYKGHFNHWEYENYLRKSKLYVDATFNWQGGGFGVKLARALATGIPVIWHYTKGIELEGFEKGNQLNWSSSPEETLSLVDYYLTNDKERVEMGKRGKEWFLNNWLWSKNIKRIVDAFK